ncbi:MAG: DUF1553 domain-containing protein [Planctomycetaceae bacterium]|nr:DUF1553 domain-containing protein [Planctomycetaceae bacterium]
MMPDLNIIQSLIVLSLCLMTAHSGSAAEQTAPSFQNDIVPVLTRYGCNSGGCHGKLAGQNGFRLSLRGFAPQQDYESMTWESRGRRISPLAPLNSLLLQKAIGTVPHGGGRRFDIDSPAAQLLVDWINEGMPGPDIDEPEFLSLSISSTPDQSVLKPGESVTLKVIAAYNDGTQRDITWLTSFASGDPTVIEVTEEGVVRSLRSGETVIRAAFREQIAIAQFTVPYERQPEAIVFEARSNQLDGPVFDKLRDLRIEPSSECDDATFLRRASLDAIGVLPTPEEVRAFLADERSDKRQRLVDSLLERPEFVDYWTHWLADLLQNRKERDHDVRGTKGVRNFHTWLRKQVAANRSWKQIASEVLSATGSTTEVPAVGYYIVTVGEKDAEQSEVADSVAQAFLGTRIGCARCHNHPLEKYTQDDYYHFAGFFSRVALQRQNPEAGPTELIIGTRHLLNLQKELGQQREKLTELESPADVTVKVDNEQIENVRKRIEDLQRQIEETQNRKVEVRQPRTGEMLQPRPLDRSEITLATGEDPRSPFIAWMTAPANEAFSGAMVNRLWKHFLGIGLVEPVDDLRATNPPSNPELWKVLNQEFVENDFDLKHMMRLIMNSRTYQLAADTTESNFRDDRFYSHFQSRRLSAEVLLDAICSATGQPESYAGYPQGIRAVQVPDPFTDSYFLTMFGRAPRTTACACEQETDVTLPQLLHLQNSDELTAKVTSAEGRLANLLKSTEDDSRLIEEVYLATLNRLPSESERQAVLKQFAGSTRDETAADLFWALLNTSEFTFNH